MRPRSIRLLAALAVVAGCTRPAPTPHNYGAVAPADARSVLNALTPEMYGAIGGDALDDTAAIQAALTAAGNAGGGIVLLNGSGYLYSSLNVPVNVTLGRPGRRAEGYGSQGGVTNYTAAATLVCTLATAATAPASTPTILLNHHSSLEGVSVYDQVQGTTTNARPYLVGTPAYGAGGTLNPTIRGVALLNCYQGIRLWGGGRALVEDVYVSALYQGIWCDQFGDTTRLSKVSIVPLAYLDGSSASATAQAYIQANLIAYRFGRVDSLLVEDCMVYLAQTGVRLEQSTQATNPIAPWARFVNIDIDVCDVCVDVYATANQGVEFAGGSWTTPGGTPNNFALRVGSGASDLTLTAVHLQAQGSTGNEATVAGGSVVLQGCYLNSFGNSGGSKASILATGGGLTVANCVYRDARCPLSVTAASGACPTVYSGNRNPGGVAVNDPNSNVTSSGNH